MDSPLDIDCVGPGGVLYWRSIFSPSRLDPVEVPLSFVGIILGRGRFFLQSLPSEFSFGWSSGPPICRCEE